MSDILTLIKNRDVNGIELYQFVSRAFKDGCVPQDSKAFFNCFSTETTDGSLCFANQFGKGENDVAMLFFYPTFCAVPIKYRKNLRNGEYCNISLLILEYQRMIAEKTNSVELLQAIKHHAARRITDVELHLNFAICYYEEGEEGLMQKSKLDAEVDRRRGSLAHYKEQYKTLISFIDEKIARIESDASASDSEEASV